MYFDLTEPFGYVKIFNVSISRHVGMADDADSKSVAGNRVWVQVPPPAVLKLVFTGFYLYITRRRL